MHAPSNRAGFGMVVIAMLFTAFAVIAAVALDRSSVQIELNRQKQVQEQLKRLHIALAKYVRYNDRFPCPASYLVASNDVSFGSTAAATCSGGAAPAGTQLLTGLNTKVILGMVPVKELAVYGISFNDAFDPWGARIAYAVHRELTPGTSSATISAIVLTERPQVTDYATGQLFSPEPDSVLISYGRDRVHGRLRDQAVLTNPANNTCGATERRHENCDADNIFLVGPLFASPQAATTNYFDDTVSVLRYFAP